MRLTSGDLNIYETFLSLLAWNKKYLRFSHSDLEAASSL